MSNNLFSLGTQKLHINFGAPSFLGKISENKSCIQTRKFSRILVRHLSLERLAKEKQNEKNHVSIKEKPDVVFKKTNPFLCKEKCLYPQKKQDGNNFVVFTFGEQMLKSMTFNRAIKEKQNDFHSTTRMPGKKGLGDALLYVWALGLLFIYLFVLIVMTFFAGGQQEQLLLTRMEQSRLTLFAYLQTPAEIDGAETTMQELLMHAYFSGDYSEFDAQTKEIFQPLYPREGCLTWNLYVVSLSDGNEVHRIQNYRRNIFQAEAAKVSVPLVIEERALEVQLEDVC